MSSIDKLARELKSLITESDNRKPQPYDTDAEVMRVKGDTLWVHIPGGVEETPIKKTINATTGDKVKVHIADGKAWITGNASNPPTDDTAANHATYIAEGASKEARTAAQNAQIAQEAANNAVEYAAIAKDTTDEIVAYADTAGKTVTQILHDGETAGTVAQQAKESAEIAKTSADSALVNLEQIEKVTDVISWITEHGYYTLTSDTTIVENKVYYTVVSIEITNPVDNDVKTYYEQQFKSIIDDDGVINFPYYELTSDTEVDDEKTYYHLTGTPVTQPSTHLLYTYYELSINQNEAIGQYIAAHLALTDDGLYVQTDKEENWKVLIKGDGVYIVDGTTLAASYGSSISFDPNKEFKIGNEDVFIKYFDSNNDGIADAIQIQLSELLINGLSLGQKISDIDESITASENVLSEHTSIINKTITDFQNYSNYIIIKPEEPSISIGTDAYTFLKILATKLSLVADNVEVAYLSNERLFAPSAVVTNLYMQTIDAKTGDRIGGVGWVMRSNGHLSMRPME